MRIGNSDQRVITCDNVPDSIGDLTIVLSPRTVVDSLKFAKPRTTLILLWQTKLLFLATFCSLKLHDGRPGGSEKGLHGPRLSE